MSTIILLIILISLICLSIGPSFGVPISRGFWVTLFIAQIVAIILVLIPLLGGLSTVK